MSLQREYPEKPIVGIGVLIQKNSHYLLIRRASNPDRGLWTVPGGLVEVGERVADAAIREVLEETGLVVKLKERIGVIDKIEYDERSEILYHFIILIYSSMTNVELSTLSKYFREVSLFCQLFCPK